MVASCRRIVSEEDYHQALKEPDNCRVMNRVTARYKTLDLDERQRCGLIGLWRALQYHQSGLGQRFTTSLSRFVRWECERAMRLLRSERQRYTAFRSQHVACLDNERAMRDTERRENEEHLLRRMQSLSLPQRTLIRQYFMEHRTLAEMARRRRCGTETVRRKLHQAVALLRQVCQADGVLPFCC